MNAVLGWLKTNLFIVIFGALIIALPIGGYFGASMWNASIKEKLEEALSADKRRLSGAQRVSLIVPPIEEGEEAIRLDEAPNDVIIEAVAAAREERQAQIEAVVTAAVTRNRQGRSPLVDGTVPPPEDRASVRAVVRQLGRTLPDAYEALFDSIGAGPGPDLGQIGRRIVERQRREYDRLGLDEREQPGADDAERISDILRRTRSSAQRSYAESISVFADPISVLAPSEGGGRGSEAVEYSVIPIDPDMAVGGIDNAFVWQWDYWIVQDLLEAVALANGSASGASRDARSAPVKAIERIRIVAVDLPETAEGAGAGGFGGPGGPGGFGGPNNGGGFARPPGMGDGGGRPSGFNQGGGGAAVGGPTGSAFTGRTPGATNQTYDTRVAEMTVVVESGSVSDFASAINSVNFMVVTGVQISEVDRWAELEAGRDFGEAHVVLATFTIDTAWLRFWTEDAMPPGVRSALGVPPRQADPMGGAGAMPGQQP